MKYYIQRQLNEYGPYTLADLQRYVAQGSIQLTDLTRSEGMTEWTPVSQVIGNIPIPVAAGAAVGGYAGGTGGMGLSTAQTCLARKAQYPAGIARPVPTDFHWALVLVIGFVTCGLFLGVDGSWRPSFIRKLTSNSKALLFVIFHSSVISLAVSSRG